ncbi:MAG: hypothetical protein RJA99_2106 [Pseudomonadota bacterium]|jgi:hypothetical protein
MTPTRRLPSAALALALLAASAAAPAPALATPAIDLGLPSVLSARGQKLKLAVPYGSAPGEAVSATRFEVVSVEAPPGWPAPNAAAFTVIKPARRNVVMLQSSELVDAPEVVVTLRIADQPEGAQTWRIGVPPPFGASVAALARDDASGAPEARRPVRRARARGAPAAR